MDYKTLVDCIMCKLCTYQFFNTIELRLALLYPSEMTVQKHRTLFFFPILPHFHTLNSPLADYSHNTIHNTILQQRLAV